MDLSIIIVNWNTTDLLRACLRSFAQAAHQADKLQVETLVVDNASTDGSVALIREQFPWVILIENQENVGFARANNQALQRATGSYLLLLNSDTELLPGSLQVLVAFMEDSPQVGAAGARLLNADGSLQPSCHPMLTPEREFWRLSFLDRLINRATYRMETWDVQQARRVETIKGACLLLRRKALDQIGLLDDGYFMYTEEVDLCYRLAEAGWELWWVPQAQVIHYGEASSKQAAEAMYIQLHRSKVQFYRKFGGQRRANRFKRWLRLAYWPRLLAASLGAPFSPQWASQAQTYRRLLAELGDM